MASKSAILSVKILVDQAKAASDLGKSAAGFDKFAGGLSKAAVPAAAALTAIGAGALSAANAAAEDARSADLLAQALRNNTGATKSQIAATEDWISKTSRAAAVADDELRPALATLARATGDTETAQSALSTALDVAAATGKPIETVSAALAKAYGGQTAGLKRLVPGLDAATLASGDMNAIMAELARTTGGSAAAAANSTAGQMENMKIQMGEAQEAIGGALLPVMSKLASVFKDAAIWIQQNSSVALALGGVVGGLAAAILALNGALKVHAMIQELMAINAKRAAAGQLALNASMLANPVFLVIAGVIALVAAIVLLWKKNEAFRNAVITAWNAIRAAGQAVWKAIQTAIATVITWARATFASYMAFMAALWNGIKAAAAAVWNGIKALVNVAINAIKAYINAYKTVVLAVWSAIRTGASTAWSWIKSFISGAANVIRSAWNSVKSFFSGLWSGIKSGATNAFNGLVDFVRGIPGRIKSAIGDLGSLLVSAGRNLIEGLKRGIRAVADGLKDAVLRPIKNAVGAVKGFLGISSPSRLFANIGQNTMLGLTRGIQGQLRPLQRMMGRVSTTIAGGAGSGGTALNAAVATGGGGGFGVVNNYYVTVEGGLDSADAIARRIEQVLRSRERRTSGVSLARRVT